MNEITLQIPAHADHIDVVRVCLYGVATKLSFSYEDIEDMKVAVSEACNNAVLHGASAVTDNRIDISFLFDTSSLTIKVKNSGPSFDYSNALQKAAPLPEDQVSELTIGGLGIFLMQALMDEVSIETTDQATVVSLTKYTSS